ncbi:hypothetical protein [Amycolatopsis rubida]|uniref:Uncharacterized protein n=1 Tax=Amycolatopsis rubida TaxID=112413 RepID=A0A1I5XHV3_9PSEU|nr:hypothetical protein [Amycolatopsis rubida]SFQ31524.1 hypothetical protein SAMN05421854_110244 [Amycolatopsis rubida]
MSNTTAPERAEPTPLVHWPHSGIDASTTLEVRNYKELPHADGYTFTADILHPQLGHIGSLSHEGDRRGTQFVPSDPDRFGWHEMRAYVKQCREDGLPLSEEAVLFDAVLYEQKTAQMVDAMRRNNTTLVREFVEFSSGAAIRGDVTELHRIAIMREDRELRAEILDESPSTRRASGGDWQIYNGREWKPLLVPHTLTQDEIAGKLGTIGAAFWKQEATVDGLHVNGVHQHDRHPYYVLASDELPVNHRAWCTCRIDPRAPLTRFEYWCELGLIASGQVHPLERCRRLVTID